MSTWIPERDLYLDELVRREGRGGYVKVLCDGCVREKASAPGQASYRCLSCMPGPLLCQDCLCRRHKHVPFHRIQVRQRKSSSSRLKLTVVHARFFLRGGRGVRSNPPPSPRPVFAFNSVISTARRAQILKLLFLVSVSSTLTAVTPSPSPSVPATGHTTPEHSFSNSCVTTYTPPPTSNHTPPSRSGCSNTTTHSRFKGKFRCSTTTSPSTASRTTLVPGSPHRVTRNS